MIQRFRDVLVTTTPSRKAIYLNPLRRGRWFEVK